VHSEIDNIVTVLHSQLTSIDLIEENHILHDMQIVKYTYAYPSASCNKKHYIMFLHTAQCPSQLGYKSFSHEFFNTSILRLRQHPYPWFETIVNKTPVKL